MIPKFISNASAFPASPRPRANLESARIDDCLRITIGTDDECDALIAALKNILD